MIVAAAPGQNALSITVFDRGVAFDKSNAASFLRNVNEGRPTGWQLLGGTLDDGSLPVKSTRFTNTFRRPDGTLLFQYGYLLTDSERTYMLQQSAASTTEPSVFREFARSFKFLHQPKTSKRTAVLVGLVAAVLAVALAVVQVARH